MFVFEDIKSLDDRSMQRLLRDVNAKDLSMALRGATEELKNRVFKNMSSRAAQALRDDMSVAGPVRLRLVEEAQQRIINTVRALQEAEEIVVSRGDQDVLI
jgi:flagellar motor switch protein FliG